ncbi:MAG: hypothetical protein ACFFDY_00090 [Candidatus Thorarchaeota archaeon]
MEMYISRIQNLRSNLDQEKGRRDEILETISDIKKDLKKQMHLEQIIKETSFIINEVAQNTQRKLEFCLSELVTLALSSTFPEKGYKFKVIFEKKKGKTEVSFNFEDRNGELIDPMDDSGGGVIDIASFALRLALYAIMPNKPDNVFILDEPFKHLRGTTNQERTSEMIKMISKKLGIQMIIISDVNFSINSDKVFEVENIEPYKSIIKEK